MSVFPALDVLQIEGPPMSDFEVNGKTYKYKTWAIGTYEDDKELAHKLLSEAYVKLLNSIVLSALYDKKEGEMARFMGTVYKHIPLFVWRQSPEIYSGSDGETCISFRLAIIKAEEASEVLSHLKKEVA